MAAQSLTPEQQKIVAAVNADTDDSLKLLEQIVKHQQRDFECGGRSFFFLGAMEDAAEDLIEPDRKIFQLIGQIGHT